MIAAPGTRLLTETALVGFGAAAGIGVSVVEAGPGSLESEGDRLMIEKVKRKGTVGAD